MVGVYSTAITHLGHTDLATTQQERKKINYAVEERGFTYYATVHDYIYACYQNTIYSNTSKRRTEPCHVIKHIRNLSSIQVHAVLCKPHTSKTCTRREAFLLYDKRIEKQRK